MPPAGADGAQEVGGARAGRDDLGAGKRSLAVVDIPHMCSTEGHTLLEHARAGDYHRFLIRRDEMASR